MINITMINPTARMPFTTSFIVLTFFKIKPIIIATTINNIETEAAEAFAREVASV